MVRSLPILFLLGMIVSQASGKPEQTGSYTSLNGLHMYYEIHGSGTPVVLIHGGFSTIGSTFGRVLPEFAKMHQVIAVELQAHGHTLDIDRPLSFEQDADDVAVLLQQLKVRKANIIGFSHGGTTALQITIRHPDLVNKLVLLSATYKRSGTQPGVFEALQGASLDKPMPQPLKDAYLKANPDPTGLQKMFDRDVARTIAFKDVSDEQIKAIQSPALVITAMMLILPVPNMCSSWRARYRTRGWRFCPALMANISEKSVPRIKIAKCPFWLRR
jgi:pimeloyl-ACP methyl ester carboxylesterase